MGQGRYSLVQAEMMGDRQGSDREAGEGWSHLLRTQKQLLLPKVTPVQMWWVRSKMPCSASVKE